MKDYEYIFDAIGTRWHLQFTADASINGHALLQDIRNRIDEYDKAYSRFRADSLITQMARDRGVYTLPSDAPPLINLYYSLYKLTGGVFTPLIGNVLVEAGYDADYSLKVGELHSPPPWEEVILYNGDRTIEILKPAVLDFGAGGKGYLVDIVAELLSDRGIVSYCIDAGGDIIQRSAQHNPIEIGLENPHDTSEAIGVARLVDKSICGSAGNRRTWAHLHHIIDPRTLASPQNIVATWVVGDTALVSDALATALFFVPASQLRRQYQFEHITLYANGGAEISSGFPGELFTA